MVDQRGEGMVVKVEGVDGISGFKLKFKTNFLKFLQRHPFFTEFDVEKGYYFL